MTDRIDTKDAYGDEFSMVRGIQLRRTEPNAERNGAVVGIYADTALVALTEDGAVEVASFLGRSVSPAACRDLLAELAPLACSDDLPAAVRDFLVGEAPPLLKKITAEGVARGTVVRSLIELGRALGRAEERASLGTCDACGERASTFPTGAAGAVSLCLPCLETSAQEAISAERAKLAGLAGAARRVVEAHAARLAALDTDPVDGETYQRAIDARDTAINTIAAELAKLEGGA